MGLFRYLLFDAPFYSQKTELDTIKGVWFHDDHVVYSQMLKLLMFAIRDKIA